MVFARSPDGLRSPSARCAKLALAVRDLPWRQHVRPRTGLARAIKRPAGPADERPVEKRRKPRQQRRLACEIWIEGKRHTGFVRDVSEDGLYVQTRVRAVPGAEVGLVFAAEGSRAELRVRARVARLHRLSA